MTDDPQGKDVVAVLDSNVTDFGMVALAHVPDYKDIQGKKALALCRARMKTLSPSNPDSATFFGDDSLSDMSVVMERITKEMMQEKGGVFRTPAEALLDAMKETDTEMIGEVVNSLIESGGKAVRNNGGLIAITAASLIAGPFWLAAAGGGVIGAKNYVRRKQEMANLSNSPELIEERLRDAVSSTGKKISGLQKALDKSPVILERINAVASVNREVFYRTTQDLTAGREVLRQARDEILPALQEALNKNQIFENEEAVRMCRDFIGNLEGKLKILEMARAGSVEGTQTLAIVKQSVTDNITSLRALMTSEVPIWQRTVCMSGIAVDSYRTTRVTESFRDHVEQIGKDAGNMAILAQRAAEKGRIDNPERLLRVVSRMDDMKAALGNETKRMALLDQSSKEALDQLSDATTDILVAQAKYIEERTNGAPFALEAEDSIAVSLPSSSSRDEEEVKVKSSPARNTATKSAREQRQP